MVKEAIEKVNVAGLNVRLLVAKGAFAGTDTNQKCRIAWWLRGRSGLGRAQILGDKAAAGCGSEE
jgi:hypothetical protein